MDSKRLLKFKSNMPLALEAKLVNKYGYAVYQRIHGQFVSFEYSPRPGNVVAFTPGLSATRQSELLKRCDNIVDFFPDPYNSSRAIRIRLHNMAQTLPAHERQFIQDFMDDNFPSNDKGI